MFTHDAREAVDWAVDLVNTLPECRPGGPGPDAFTTLDDLTTFFSRPSWTGRFDRDAAELADVRALRERLRAFWNPDETRTVDLVNETLAGAGAVPRLVDHDDLGWHIHAAPLDAPLAERLLVEFAIAMIDVVRARGHDRLQVCEGQDCNAVLVDLSRNRSRRYCDGGCAARAHTAAYRARRT